MSSRARAAVNFPRYAGNVPDSEELFADAASDSFRGDAHGGITSAFPPAPRVNYPDGQAGDDDAGGVRSAASAVPASAVVTGWGAEDTAGRTRKRATRPPRSASRPETRRSVGDGRRSAHNPATISQHKRVPEVSPDRCQQPTIAASGTLRT